MIFAIIGGLLMLCQIALWRLSLQFPYGTAPWDGPLLWIAGTACVAGLSAPALVALIKRIEFSARVAAYGLLLGLVMRLVAIASTPVLEDDSYRYLWDGAVVAAGVDPYAYAPAEASPMLSSGREAPMPEDPNLVSLRKLADSAPEIQDRVNFPYVKTIYPPIAQGAFAAAHWISPFDLSAWKFVLFVVDLATVVLLAAALRAYGRSPLWATLYWWNPLVIQQVFAAGHMDGLLGPFLIAALLFVRQNRSALAGFALAGAVAVKIWPLLLAPALARRWLWRRPMFVFGAALGFGALILLWPQIRHLADPATGVAVYAENWRRNAFLFAILEDGVFGWMDDPRRTARLAVAVLVSSVAVWAALRSPSDGGGAPVAALAATTALFVLSPTGYPWYFVWIALLLPFAPSYGLAALTATLPAYYLRFLFGDDAIVFQWGIVPIAFGAPLAILAFETMRRKRQNA